MSARVITSHPNYARLLPPVFEHRDAIIIVDAPVLSALRTLPVLTSLERCRTVVYTQCAHPDYLDCLASYFVSGIVPVSSDDRVLASAVLAAEAGERTWFYQSTLTLTERLVVRELLAGRDDPEIASSLRMARKTVASHISKVLVRSGFRNRTLYSLGVLSTVELPVLERAA